METENTTNGPSKEFIDLSMTQEIKRPEEESQEFEDVCSEIFTELVECWLEKNAPRLFSQVTEAHHAKPIYKRQKSNFSFPRTTREF